MKLVAHLVLQCAIARSLAWQTPRCSFNTPRIKRGIRRWAETATVATSAEVEKWPQPEIGDIVTFDGKWKGESAIGRIAMLQYIGTRQEWIADIVTFRDEGNGVFREERRRRASKYLPVTDLAPIKASYVRAADGWKVPVNKEGKVQPDKPGYYVPPDFALPVVEVDAVKVQGFQEAYETLKARLLKETLIFGAACSLGTTAVAGPEDGAIFAAGVLAGASYLLLLERNTDRIGTASAQGTGQKYDVLASFRFAIPLALLTAVAACRYATSDESVASSMALFEILPKDQFLAAVGGFLSYRIPLLFTEIKGALTPDVTKSLTEMLPGSLGKTAEMIGKSQYQRASDDLSGPLEVADPSRILLVAGPRGAGRSSLVAALAQSGVPPADPSALGGSGSGATSGASVTVNVPPTVTTGRGTAGVGSSVVQLERDDFDSQVRSGAFVSWSEVPSSRESGSTTATANARELEGLRLADVLASGRGGNIAVIDAPTVEAADSIAAVLEDRPDVQLAAVWVSLDSLKDFEVALQAEAQGGEASQSGTSELKAVDVTESLKSVLNDIEWGVLSGLFEFTVINSDPNKALTELQNAARYLTKTRAR